MTHWANNQPDNYIPTLNKFCQEDGEDFVISRHGKWVDVRGNRKYPFVCTFQKEEKTIQNDTYSTCHIFIDLLTSDLVSSDLVPLIIDVCVEQLYDIVTDIDLFCLATANFAHQIFSHVKETYFKDYEICEMFLC